MQEIGWIKDKKKSQELMSERYDQGLLFALMSFRLESLFLNHSSKALRKRREGGLSLAKSRRFPKVPAYDGVFTFYLCVIG
jgi:hypothetical protein